PVSELPILIDHLNRSEIAVLASGDSLFFGIGSLLLQNFGRERLRFHPNISSIQRSMHLIGLSWQDAEIVSLHGRPLSSLRRYLAPNTLLGIFTDQTNHPVIIAGELVSHGLDDATVWIAEALGTEQQKLSQFSANELCVSEKTFNPLNVVVVQTAAARPSLPVFPGIPDHLFSTGAKPGFGMISKREVRLAILSLMQPSPGQVAWDIGAGCGSVSVEWARWNPRGTIYAVESDVDRVQHILENCERFGVEQNCRVVEGIAPEQCEDLPSPHCIFIGGSNGNLEQLLAVCWSRLLAEGSLVASAVTEDSRAILNLFAEQQRAATHTVEWIEIAVEKNLPQSDERRSLLPVQLISCTKTPVDP
nr:precorrin-6y C5,15-methyltransferase (decarboxylating) subunit CbiE [Granulosicoccus sp.]